MKAKYVYSNGSNISKKAERSTLELCVTLKGIGTSSYPRNCVDIFSFSIRDVFHLHGALQVDPELYTIDLVSTAGSITPLRAGLQWLSSKGPGVDRSREGQF